MSAALSPDVRICRACSIALLKPRYGRPLSLSASLPRLAVTPVVGSDVGRSGGGHGSAQGKSRYSCPNRYPAQRTVEYPSRSISSAHAAAIR